MRLEDGRIALALLLATAACDDRITILQPLPIDDTPSGRSVTTEVLPPLGDEPSTSGNGSCEAFAELTLTCPALDGECPGELQAQCIVDSASSFDGYCEVSSGAEVCEGHEVSAAYVEYCLIQSCLGESYATCIQQGQEACQPTTCERIEAIAGQCPGYGYACEDEPEEHSLCFLSVLEQLGDPCILFDDLDRLCVDRNVSIEGDASCQVQACFDLTTYESCWGDLDVLCDWVP